MRQYKYSFVLLVALLLVQSAWAQKAKNKSKVKYSKTEVVEDNGSSSEDVTTLREEVVTPSVPQDRMDTLYYNKDWKITKNKAFSNYYRLALYPANPEAAKEFRTYYMSGELQGEGNFEELSSTHDAASKFCGSIVTYFKNGKVQEQKTFVGGKLSGEWITYYENGNVKDHYFMENGEKTGVAASFTENGKVCTLTPYTNYVQEGYYVVVDVDGNYSKYSLADNQPILETPKLEEIETEYKNGVAWPYYNKNGLIVGVSNSLVDENIGDYREIGVFIVNKSMNNVDIDPAQIEIYDIKGGKRKDFELVGAEEYDKKILKFKKKVAKRTVKNKFVVQTERENNVNANLGAQVFDSGTANLLKDFQTRICKMRKLEAGNRMKYAEKMPEDLGYLERTTIHPGEIVSGYLYTSDRKVSDFFVKVNIKGIDYLFEWKQEKKK